MPTRKAFFLFGPRGTGKSTWTKSSYPSAHFIDLLSSRPALHYQKDPTLLSDEVQVLPTKTWVVIDEIQRVPDLLNEVHALMENHGYKRFILTGSSARKLKCGAANLLAGRAILRNLFPLTSKEIDYGLSPERILNYGLLPASVTARTDSYRREFLTSYVQVYLNEEIKAEGLVRQIGQFARFLEVASLTAGQKISIAGLSRDAAISRDTARGYFSLFEDTLLGTKLPAYRPRPKVKEVSHPKF